MRGAWKRAENEQSGGRAMPSEGRGQGFESFGCAKNIIQINDLKAHVVAMSRL